MDAQAINSKHQAKQELPEAPVNLTSSAKTATSVDLAWDVVSQADGYHIYQDAVKVDSVTTNSYSVTGLTTATSYDFYVKAYNANGESEKSNTVTVTTT